MKKNLLFLMSALALCACTSQGDKPSSKSLVLYYSQTSTTQQVAKLLQFKTGADIDSIVCEQPYDGDFNQTIVRCQKEFADNDAPVIQKLTRNVANYDTIYLGYPVWFGTYAQPIAGLIKQVDLSGKVVIPFCTFGSGGLNTSTDKLKAALPGAKLLPGYGVRTARVSAASEELDKFLIQIGVKPGQLPELPSYSDKQPVTDADVEIFNAACGSYPMPLGTPVEVCSRTLDNGTDYEFTVETATPDGNKVRSRIYILIGKEEGAAPEFIMAKR